MSEGGREEEKKESGRSLERKRGREMVTSVCADQVLV